MSEYAAFLRGVNVGGKNIIKMNELQTILVKHGLKNVLTYINSGNIIFTHSDGKKNLENKIIKITNDKFNLNINLIIKSKADIKEIISFHPFTGLENDNSKKMVVMLSEKIDKDKAMQFKRELRIEENYYHHNDLLYIYYHNGAGRSKFTNSFIDGKLNVISTSRNWNTIIKVNEMLDIVQE
jgi:uncharacterized protein (DUF1697 family)